VEARASFTFPRLGQGPLLPLLGGFHLGQLGQRRFHPRQPFLRGAVLGRL